MSKVFYDSLVGDCIVKPINFSKRKSNNVNGQVSLARIGEILGLYRELNRESKDADILYLTISESFAGNLKDLMFYLLAFRRLDKMYIHLHGGSIKRLLWDKRPWLFKINKYFISKLAGVIISGESHSEVFRGIVPEHKIHTATNFANDHIFSSKAEVQANFENLSTIRLLFLSNFHVEKGYQLLLDGFKKLSAETRKGVRLDFAGKFNDEERERQFIDEIKDIKEICYNGMVADEKKASLFKEAHVFFLPTLFLEGQPISILEAYASGTFVVSTGLGGIPDIFRAPTNGYQVEANSADSLTESIQYICNNKENLKAVALGNYELAKAKYRTHQYSDRLRKIINVDSNVLVEN